MRVTWLGWAGIELEQNGTCILIDPLINPAAVYAAAGESATGVTLPELTAPSAGPAATAVLLTHLHRDHADAEAVTRWADPDARIVGSRSVPAAGPVDDAGIAAARAEFAAAALQIGEAGEWQSFEIGPFTLTALPAADGTGESQVSWAVAAGGHASCTAVTRCFTAGGGAWPTRPVRLTPPSSRSTARSSTSPGVSRRVPTPR